MIRKLTNGILALGVLLAVGITNANAQDEVTDADIRDYAIIELAKSSITDGISPMVNDMIEKQEGMTGQRFQELQKSTDGAEEWEVQFLGVVNKQIDKKKKAATDVVKLLAANAMGGAKYKATKAAIKADAAVKAKYQAFLDAMK